MYLVFAFHVCFCLHVSFFVLLCLLQQWLSYAVAVGVAVADVDANAACVVTAGVANIVVAVTVVVTVVVVSSDVCKVTIAMTTIA